MRKSLLFIIFLLHAFCLFPGTGTILQDVQQDSIGEQPVVFPLDFRTEKLENLRQDPAFDYSESPEEENWWTRFKQYINLQWKKLINWLFGDVEATGFLLFLLEAIPYLILLAVLGFLAYLFAKLNPAASMFSATQEGEMMFAKEEDIIQFQNIPALIEQAVASADYRLAVRYHFLYLLQQLSKRGVITYDKTKTDEDYLHEIKEELKPGFQKLSRIYDYIWYGKFETGEETYYQIAKEFRQMENAIGLSHEQNV